MMQHAATGPTDFHALFSTTVCVCVLFSSLNKSMSSRSRPSCCRQLSLCVSVCFGPYAFFFGSRASDMTNCQSCFAVTSHTHDFIHSRITSSYEHVRHSA